MFRRWPNTLRDLAAPSAARQTGEKLYCRTGDRRAPADQPPGRFVADSPLEGAVRCELVSAAGPDTAPDEYLESIKKGGLLISCNQNLFYMVSMFLAPFEAVTSIIATLFLPNPVPSGST